MKLKDIFLLILILIIAVAVIWFFVMAPSFFQNFFEMNTENPPKPIAEYGEFPFKLVYEIDGEVITIEDTFIIEYKGVRYNEGMGKYNVWDTSLKSGRDKEENPQGTGFINAITIFDGVAKNGTSSKVLFRLGTCEHYMGLPEADVSLQYSSVEAGDMVTSYSPYTPLSDVELKTLYGITIREKTLSEPITN